MSRTTIDSVYAGSADLFHRGPDGEGYLSLGTDSEDPFLATPRPEVPPGPLALALSFRRLAIQDLSAAGNQPMVSSDGRYAIALNGEIYNFRELREELRTDWRFASSSDTEVGLAALATWGCEALDRFIGMFAIVFVDRLRRTVSLYRDPFGIKPLYLRFRGDEVIFASEAKVLIDRFEPSSPQIDPQRAFEYLRFGVTDHDEGTLLQDIRQLRPGDRWNFGIGGDPGSPTRKALRPLDEKPGWSFQEASTLLRDALLESVELHLRSDVPVGVLLSGGIDSSTIAGAVREIDQNWKERRIFTFVPDDPRLSEERFARIVCEHTGFAAARIQLDARGLAEDLEGIVSRQDFPFGSTSVFAQGRIFKAVSEHGLNVVLDGQGADELFGGYRTYLGARAVSHLLSGQLGEASRFLKRAMSLPGVTPSFLLSRVIGHLLPGRLQETARFLGGEPLVPKWLNAQWLRSHRVSARPLWKRSGRSVLREQLDAAFTRTSLPMLLRWEDRNSMAYSIESRVPFLTPKIASLAMSMPEQFLISSEGDTKAVLRRAAKGLIPEEVRLRRDKIGFATPERAWLEPLAPWIDELFRESATRVPIVDWAEAQREANELLRGRGSFDFRLWRWINLALWSRRFDVRYV
ncbi:MAG: asparagine synthase (glutamine-hydrolyzing) [Myxococcales bacterium]|nr:asparagine synthase (glutamine-hydrolyzing) [Myxococcales bacterium]